ncbi:hypothetical protein ACTOWA_00095 [Herbaspirillum seropedicae]|uniref:hypothetical protein n=1 Tax=Herbaspirillum seropedicae TaxID=964 RepID=UPI0028561500|nr:hypothetical protein [Herbaspirillum seropedicae]MDR6398012.1 hypothetical protein [Herbaspirillum seropedicae]
MSASVKKESPVQITKLGWLYLGIFIAVTAFFGRHQMMDAAGWLATKVSGQIKVPAAPKQEAKAVNARIGQAAVNKVNPAAQGQATAVPPASEERADTKQFVTKVAELQGQLDVAKRESSVLRSIANTVFQEQHRMIAEVEATVKSVGMRVAQLPVANQQQKIAKDEAAALVQGMQKSVQAAKAKTVDISSLPIEFVTVQSSGIQAIYKDGLILNGQRVALGQKLPSGETLVGIDTEYRTVVTDRRILNITA